MENNTGTYTQMYNGPLVFAPDDVEYDPRYYSLNAGFMISPTHRLAQDRPTVTVCIPAEKLIGNTEGGMPLKRLRYYLNHMKNDTATYQDMYEGDVIVTPAFDCERDSEYPDRRPDYYHGDLMLNIEPSNRIQKDKPTLTWHIPVARLGLDGVPSPAVAAADHCLRAFAPYIDELNAALYNRSRPDNENGKYYLYRPGGEVLLRNTSFFALCPERDYEYLGGAGVRLLDDGKERRLQECLCIRMQVQLPKAKLKKTIQMLCRDLPDAVDRFIAGFDVPALERALALAEKQAAIRSRLQTGDYCAFIANGSILPRAKGTQAPMEGAVPFRSTPEDEIEICGVRGMGIRRGVTVITGGGYSGKSTLLDAISAGIYDHVSGDGRELCITDESAVTISAEDGRSVKCVNVSPFIRWLPGGDTASFSTDRASGSTSQAANIAEAVDGGARLLLIDEDRSATNFMIRDRMMKTLIKREPITPFTDRVRELSAELGVSTVLVIGGSGEYLRVADRVYMMEDFMISDATEEAKRVARENGVTPGTPQKAQWGLARTLLAEGFTSYPEGSGSERLAVSHAGLVSVGDETVDLRGLHDLATPAQLDALGFELRYLMVSNADSEIDVRRRIDELYARIAKEGLDCVWTSYFTTCERFLDLPRKCELLAVINRMRKITALSVEEKPLDGRE